MSTLTSASTLAEIQAAYDDNASYAEDGSVAKAKAFITACRMLLRRTPISSTNPGFSIVLSPQLIRDELNAAIEWLASRADVDGGAAVTHFSVEDFRQ